MNVKTTNRNVIKKWLLVLLLSLSVTYIYFKPQQFTNLWLTADQQAQILFSLGHYQQASQHYTNVQWQAFSAYGAQDYKNSAILYSQFTDQHSKLAQANAFAHGREYLKARDIYQALLNKDPNNADAKNNITLVQKIIDETNLLSASQQAEEGEAIKELSKDDARAADGAEREVARKQEMEQLSSEQLLLDPALNDAWLRQVQKNPARFLSQKFYIQLELRQNKNTSKSENRDKNINKNTEETSDDTP